MSILTAPEGVQQVLQSGSSTVAYSAVSTGAHAVRDGSGAALAGAEVLQSPAIAFQSPVFVGFSPVAFAVPLP